MSYIYCIDLNANRRRKIFLHPPTQPDLLRGILENSAAGEADRIPVLDMPGYSMSFQGGKRCLLVHVWQHNLPLVSVALVASARCAKKYWSMIREMVLIDDIPCAVAQDDIPATPFAAMKRHADDVPDAIIEMLLEIANDHALLRHPGDRS